MYAAPASFRSRRAHRHNGAPFPFAAPAAQNGKRGYTAAANRDRWSFFPRAGRWDGLVRWGWHSIVQVRAACKSPRQQRQHEGSEAQSAACSQSAGLRGESKHPSEWLWLFPMRALACGRMLQLPTAILSVASANVWGSISARSHHRILRPGNGPKGTTQRLVRRGTGPSGYSQSWAAGAADPRGVVAGGLLSHFPSAPSRAPSRIPPSSR